MIMDGYGSLSEQYADGINCLSSKNKGTVTLYAIWEKVQ